MNTWKRLALLLSLGLALGLAGCGGDDGDGNGKGGDGGCEGSNATLAGSCTDTLGSCYEVRGNVSEFDPEAECVDEEGTWSTSGCAESTKVNGACVANIFGTVTVNYEPNSTPAEWKTACESAGFLCYIAP